MTQAPRLFIVCNAILLLCILFAVPPLADADTVHVNAPPKRIQIWGKSISLKRWKSIQATLDCWGGTGTWVHSPQHREESYPSKTYDMVSECHDTRRPGLDYMWDVPWMGNATQVKAWEAGQLKHLPCEHALRHLTQTEICHILGGLKMLIIGDSLNQQLVHTFAGSVAGFTQLPCMDWTQPGICPGNLQCRAGTEVKDWYISYVRNDRISLITEPVVEWEANFHDFPWIQYVPPLAASNSQHPPEFNVVIANKGAHYEEDNLFVPKLRETLKYVTEHLPNALIIYRNTPSGHKGCPECCQNRDSPPLKTPLPLEGMPYNWGNFPRQNQLTKELIEKEFPNVLYLDVATPTSYRADSHRCGQWVDGIHYCIPGPLDTWARMIYNALALVHAAENDV